MLFNTRSLLLATVAAVAVTVQAAPIASESSFLAARGLITEPMTEDLTFEARGLDADWSESDELYAREVLGDDHVDELIARGFGKFLKKAAKGAFHVATSVLRRDLDDETNTAAESGLYIRDLLADGSEDADELFARAMIGDEDEADALIARGFGKFLKKAAKGAFHVATSILRRDVVDGEADEESEMYIRDLLTSDAEEDNELLARHLLGDDDVDALVARGFGKKLWSGVKKAGRIGLTAASYL